MNQPLRNRKIKAKATGLCEIKGIEKGEIINYL